jgi:hypothetical protein
LILLGVFGKTKSTSCCALERWTCFNFEVTSFLQLFAQERLP